MTFSGKLLVCPLNTTVKSPQIFQWRKSFYSRWPPWPLVAYCYTLKSCKFLNICHRKTLLGCIPMFWKTENTVESLFQRKSQPCRWKSNMAAITKRILSTTLEWSPNQHIFRMAAIHILEMKIGITQWLIGWFLWSWCQTYGFRDAESITGGKK